MWNKAVEDFVSEDSSNIHMFVEHRHDSHSFKTILDKVQRFKKKSFHSFAMRTGHHKWATSGGQILLPDNHLHTLGIGEQQLEQVGHTDESRWTPMVLRTKSVSILIILLYLRTAEGMSEGNVEVLHQAFTLASSFSGLVLMGGDWNMTPTELYESPWVRYLGLKLITPPKLGYTCTAGTGRLIDYFVASDKLADLITAEAQFDVPWKVHVGIRLAFPARLRAHMVPTLRIPRVLPRLGKDHQFDNEVWELSCDFADDFVRKWSSGTGILGCSQSMLEHVDLGQRYLSGKLSTEASRIEAYLCYTQGITGRQALPYMGRGGLPHVSARPAIQRQPVSSRYACPATDFWSRTETLLAWLMKPTALTDAALIQPVVALKSMQRGFNEYWQSKAAPNCPPHAWRAWITGLTPAYIYNKGGQYTPERLAVWMSRASAQKKKSEQLRKLADKKAFRQWLSNDLNKGASGAHALVKPKPKWGEAEEPAKAFMQWSKIWKDTSHNSAESERSAGIFQLAVPWKEQLHTALQNNATGMCRGDDFFDSIRKIRQKGQVGTDGSFAHLPADFMLLFSEYVCGSNERIPVEEFREATKHYPDKKAMGVDWWILSQLGQLPEQLLEPLCQVLELAQAILNWPLQMLMNLVVLVPKQTYGERPITKTPMLYRAWNIIRASKVKQWAADTAQPWDYAAAGRSATQSAASRCLMNELAVLSGKHVASLLWDMEKFFDTVHPTLVLQEGLDHSYPKEDLVMALLMHTAPRVLVLKGVCSNIMEATVSILAGCTHSVRFGRLVMHRPLLRTRSDVPAVRNFSLVDDVSQTAIGTYKQVLEDIVHAGQTFTGQVRLAKLKISSKSVVVASSPQLGRAISKILKHRSSVEIKYQESGRDLGVLNNPTGRRSTVLQTQRLTKAKHRLKRIAPLAKAVRRASVLAYTGALPQACWGAAALGISPTQLRTLRSAYAAATGINGKGRCASTAIAITMGHKRDPIVEVAVQQMSLWIDLWRGEPALRALACRYWKVAVQRITPDTMRDQAPGVSAPSVGQAPVAAQVLWNQVIGPFTATLASLKQHRWEIQEVGTFKDPHGTIWRPDLDADKGPFLDLVASFVLDSVWKDAANFHNGQGLQAGVDWEGTLALMKHVKKQLATDDVDAVEQVEHEAAADGSPLWTGRSLVWLELILTGGYWTAQRRAKIDGSSPICPRCHRAEESEEHLFWGCPANEGLDDPRVADSQRLAASARDDMQQQPCLWLRGLLPNNLVAINATYENDFCWHYVGRPPRGPWPQGRYHTDASGGQFSNIKILRRCGIGIAYLAQEEHYFQGLDFDLFEDSLFIWGAFSPLPGGLHTVPRGELQALVAIVQNVLFGDVTIVTDSKINVDMFNMGPEHCKQSTNADLWQVFWQNVQDKQLQVEVYWVKSHVDTPQGIVEHGISTRDLIGNGCADKLADRGAELAQVSMQDSMNVLWHYSAVKQVQARMIAILQATMDLDRKAEVRPPLAAPQKPMSRTGEILRSKHSFLSFSKTLFCTKCLLRAPSAAGERRAFVNSQCNPNHEMLRTMVIGSTKPTRVPVGKTVMVGRSELHPTHQLNLYKGLYFCKECGYNASAKAQKLRLQCTDRSHEAKMRVVRLLQGKLPSGLNGWPNEMSTKPGAMLQLG